jgi:hypothetical protein
MANFLAVNKALKKAFPDLDIEAVRGSGYVYFDGNDGFDKVNSIYVHPSSINTSEMIQLVIEAVSYQQEKNSEV